MPERRFTSAKGFSRTKQRLSQGHSSTARAADPKNEDDDQGLQPADDREWAETLAHFLPSEAQAPDQPVVIAHSTSPYNTGSSSTHEATPSDARAGERDEWLQSQMKVLPTAVRLEISQVWQMKPL